MQNDAAVSGHAYPASDPAALNKTISSHNLVAGSKWSYRKFPFPHIFVEQVFVDSVYRQLLAGFRKCLQARDAGHADATRFAYHKQTFDAFVMAFTPTMTGPLSLFVSRGWVDLLSSAVGIQTTRDVNGALHYHPTGSKDGFIHKDFSFCWFVDNPRPDGVNVADNAVCNYRTGATSTEGAVARERVRAVAMIYYLNNAPWSPGDGGETGLYQREVDLVGNPAVAIPPMNNTMLLFECSPYSLHSFISNQRNPRSNIAMWLHRTGPDTAAKWGEDTIIRVKQ